MKLRTQFFILVGGIIAVPFLVSAFMVLVQLSIIRGREPLPNYAEMRAWVLGHVPLAVRRHDLAALMDHRPPGLDIVIMNKNQVVTSSTIAELPVGTSAAGGALWAYVSANAEHFHFQFDSAEPRGGDDSLVILKLPRMRPDEARFRNLMIQVVMYTSVALLLFSSLMSFFILRSLNGSIQSLEGATRRIAGGDLDFDLPGAATTRSPP